MPLTPTYRALTSYSPTSVQRSWLDVAEKHERQLLSVNIAFLSSLALALSVEMLIVLFGDCQRSKQYDCDHYYM